jgi:hypothetical protein
MATTQQQQINTLQTQVAALQKSDTAQNAAISTLQTQVAALEAAGPTPPPTTNEPVAVQGLNWTQRQNLNFGTATGNNVTKLTDFLAAKWQSQAAQWGLETGVKVTANTDTHFQVATDHVDLVDIYTGGTPAQGNGSITAPSFFCNVSDLGLASAVGYFEATVQIPNVLGMWPAWWCIGWNTATKSSTWGPEIDFFEFYGASDKGPNFPMSTLHSPAPESLCFMPPPGVNEGPTGPWIPGNAFPESFPGSLYWTGAGRAAGGVAWPYSQGTGTADYSAGFHRFGCKIAEDFTITIWIDDVEWAQFNAKQYCTDAGVAVVPQLIFDFAVFSQPTLADFGGTNNSKATNKWRYSIKNIQVWSPSNAPM